MSRLNEIVQRHLSAGTVLGGRTIVREMREWLRNGHPPKSDGENQFLRKSPENFIFKRREISHRKLLDGNRWEAEPKTKFDQAMRTSRWNEKSNKSRHKTKHNKRQTKQTKKKREKETMGVLLSLCVCVRRSFPCEKKTRQYWLRPYGYTLYA